MTEELQEQLEYIDEIRKKGLISNEFKAWHSKCVLIIENIFGANSIQIQRFKNISFSPQNEGSRTPNFSREKSFLSGLNEAKILISSCIKNFDQPESKYSRKEDIQFIENLCIYFPRVARQISAKYRNRNFIDIKDEYDVQHLFHALLLIRFDDIRPEDVNSSYAGATSRVDFSLKRSKIVIEIKKTRENLKDKDIGEQLLIDMKRYSQNQDCETLICFVYDPDQLILNPYGLENDLSGQHDRIEVKVIIAPKN
jgi:REase_DpnII-MboI